MSDGDYYRWEFLFTLNEECRFIEIKDPPNIELKKNTDENGMKSVHEFTVNVKSFTEEEALDNAKIQAKRLTDILAALSAKHLGHNLVGYTRYGLNIREIGTSGKVNVLFTARYGRESPEPVDLSQDKVVQLLTTLKPESKIHRLVERLNHVNNGLEAAKNKLYEVMIKEFYLVIAHQPDARKYEPLRDVLSHHEQIKPSTLKKLEDNFGHRYFDLPTYRFDHSSPKNIENLETEANNLVKMALEYIHREIQKQ